jgi:hypothetical protein
MSRLFVSSVCRQIIRHQEDDTLTIFLCLSFNPKLMYFLNNEYIRQLIRHAHVYMDNAMYVLRYVCITLCMLIRCMLGEFDIDTCATHFAKINVISIDILSLII